MADKEDKAEPRSRDKSRDYSWTTHKTFFPWGHLFVLNKSCLLKFFSFLRKRREYYCQQECDQNGLRETAG